MFSLQRWKIHEKYKAAHDKLSKTSDFRRLPGPVFDMSAGSFSRTTAGNRAYVYCR